LSFAHGENHNGYGRRANDTQTGRTTYQAWVEELKACWRHAAAGEQQIEVVLHEVTFIGEDMGRIIGN